MEYSKSEESFEFFIWDRLGWGGRGKEVVFLIGVVGVLEGNLEEVLYIRVEGG